MLADQHETKGRRDEMRNGDCGDSEFCADADGEQRSKDAADSEARDGSHSAGDQCGDGNESIEEH